MNTRLPRLLTVAVASLAMAIPFGRVSGQMPARAPRYAITNAKIVTAAGATIDKGTVVMRDGVIEDVGPAVTAPADALIVDGTGLVVYPGLIDMANSSVIEGRGGAGGNAAAVQGGAAPAGRGAAVATPDAITWADQEREARERYLNPDTEAATLVQLEGDDLRRLAASGVTSALAVPSQGIIRGQSALVNVTAPPDPAETSALATYRRGVVVLRAPVAQHIVFATGAPGAGAGGGGGYPGALLGVIAFARQSFLDAQWQKEARAYNERHKDAAVGGFEPVLDALAPALERKVPVAFEASEEREIVRALSFAREFNLDPIIIGGAEAANVIEELKAAKAKVIVSTNFQAVGGGGRGGFGGGRGGDADTPIRVTRMRQNAAKVASALEKAGIPYAFTSGGVQNPGDFVRNVSRAIKDGGLPEDSALKALTVNAAKLAGAGERLGTIEKGRLANVIVTEGNLFENGRIRHVFVAGWPVDLDFPAQPAGGRGGRGAQ